MPKMYTELAAWWPLLSPPEDYIDEATFFKLVIVQAGLPPAPTLLELGCGGGNNAMHLKALFAHVTLTDLSPQMLAVSRTLNPDCEHVVGDMRTLRLQRTFHVVFIHDAIDYMTTLDDLRLALETAFVHCKPGGLALLVPDYVRETFEPTTDHGGSDGEERALRYLEWTYDPDDTDRPIRLTTPICCGKRTNRRESRMTGTSAGFSLVTSGYGCCAKQDFSRRSPTTNTSERYLSHAARPTDGRVRPNMRLH